MQEKINIRQGECAIHPDVTQPRQALSFPCQKDRFSLPTHTHNLEKGGGDRTCKYGIDKWQRPVFTP